MAALAEVTVKDEVQFNHTDARAPYEEILLISVCVIGRLLSHGKYTGLNMNIHIDNRSFMVQWVQRKLSTALP